MKRKKGQNRLLQYLSYQKVGVQAHAPQPVVMLLLFDAVQADDSMTIGPSNPWRYLAQPTVRCSSKLMPGQAITRTPILHGTRAGDLSVYHGYATCCR